MNATELDPLLALRPRRPIDQLETTPLHVHITIIPCRHRSGYKSTVSITDGLTVVGHTMPEIFPTQGVGWTAGQAEASRLLDRMFEEQSRTAEPG